MASIQGRWYGRFLLDEQGGAPGYGIVLSKAVQMGFNWHIATIMIADEVVRTMIRRPLASVFVGPFYLVVVTRVDVMLSMVKHDDQQREKWIQSTNMVVVEEWSLPMDRVGRIYLAPDLVEQYKQQVIRTSPHSDA